MKVQVKIMQVQLNFELGYFEETRSFIGVIQKNSRKGNNCIG
jgi:hypothetical protein